MNQKAKDIPGLGKSYEIHIKGHLDNQWADWVEGMEMEYLSDDETVLTGVLADQSALMGVLNVLNRLNLTILSTTVLNR